MGSINYALFLVGPLSAIYYFWLCKFVSEYIILKSWVYENSVCSAQPINHAPAVHVTVTVKLSNNCFGYRYDLNRL